MSESTSESMSDTKAMAAIGVLSREQAQAIVERAVKLSKADAVRDWLNAIIFTAALQPDQIENALTPPPYAFAEVATEVASVLTPAN